MATDIQNLGGFVWSIAEILRGDFKQSEYGKVILPFVVLRRLDCILEGSKDAVLSAAETLPDGVDEATRDMILFGAVAIQRVGISQYPDVDFPTISVSMTSRVASHLAAGSIAWFSRFRLTAPCTVDQNINP